MNNTVTTEVTQDSRNMALLIWIGTFFFGFIPGIIMYIWKKEDGYVFDQAKESINWSITALGIYIVGAVLSVIYIGLFVMLLVAIAHLVFCGMGVMAASGGRQFRVPYAIRLIK